MNKLKTILSVLLMTIAAMGAKAAESFVDFKQGDWVLNNNGKVSIYVSANEQRALPPRHTIAGDASCDGPLGR